MGKLKMLVVVLAMLLMIAAPAVADSVTAQVGGVEATATSEFFGEDEATATASGVWATATSEFFDDTWLVW